jgi:hypothetical protein
MSCTKPTAKKSKAVTDPVGMDLVIPVENSVFPLCNVCKTVFIYYFMMIAYLLFILFLLVTSLVPNGGGETKVTDLTIGDLYVFFSSQINDRLSFF